MYHVEKVFDRVSKYFSWQNHGIGQGKTKSNDKAITDYRRERNSSLSSDIQTLNVEEVKVKQEGEKSTWGEFHFIAKSEQRLPETNHSTLQSNHRRMLSPVVDTTKIPQEVLKDIYGGKIYKIWFSISSH